MKYVKKDELSSCRTPSNGCREGFREGFWDFIPAHILHRSVKDSGVILCRNPVGNLHSLIDGAIIL